MNYFSFPYHCRPQLVVVLYCLLNDWPFLLFWYVSVDLRRYDWVSQGCLLKAFLVFFGTCAPHLPNWPDTGKALEQYFLPGGKALRRYVFPAPFRAALHNGPRQRRWIESQYSRFVRWTSMDSLSGKTLIYTRCEALLPHWHNHHSRCANLAVYRQRTLSIKPGQW